MTPHAYIVCGLGYGDEGKGSMVDFLAREYEAKLVVRFNGGPQAAHNVVLSDGRHHEFHSLGAGSFIPGVRTHLTPHVMIEPYAIANEALAFDPTGEIMVRLSVSPICPVITPFHWLLNRMRERMRGEARHGSCGYGVGEVRWFKLQGWPGLMAHEMLDYTRAVEKLSAIKAVALSEAQGGAPGDRALILAEDPKTIAADYERFVKKLRFATHNEVKQQMEKCVTIFEGAQGVLLDEDYGFAPYNTWSKTTPLNARSFIGDAVPTTVVGVTRTYLTRHGPGPLVTEDSASAFLSVAEHNRENEWQGKLRAGWFDLPMFKYALARAGRVDTLALTHCDFSPDVFTYAREYRAKDNRIIKDLVPQPTAAELSGYFPEYITMLNYEPAEAVQIVTGVKVGYVSTGPTERDKVKL